MFGIGHQIRRCHWARVGLCLFLAAALTADTARGQTDAKSLRARLAADKGICAVLGLPAPGGPALVTELAAGSELLVYFQSPQAEEVQAVRKAAEAAGLLGKRVFADRGPWNAVPLADNLADACWASPAASDQVPKAEILRVLRPEGKAIVGQEELSKPVPAGVDAWSHPFHGPDNNPQSQDRLARMPYRTQFLADPQFSPMPEVTVAAGGRIFKAMGHIAHRANQNPMLNMLLGINAYNGTILWKRPLREGFVIHRNTMIATPEVLYLGDDQSCKRIDARTGQVRDEIVVPDGLADGKVWKWMALEAGADGRPLLVALVGGEEIRPKTVPSSIHAIGHWPWSMWEGHEYRDPKTNFGFGRTLLVIDPESKKVLRSHAEESYIDGRGICMKGGRVYYYCPDNFLACFDAVAGKVLWKRSDPELLAAIGRTGPAQNPTEGYSTTNFLKCSDRYVFFAGPQRPNLVVVSARDGGLVWHRKGGNLHLILRDDAFYAVGPGGAKLTYGTWETLVELPKRRSCTRATGSLDSIFYRAAEGTMQICTADDHAQHIAPMRPPCQDGVIVAHGMLYWGPWMCGCPLSFYGHVGLAPAGAAGDRPEDAAPQRGASQWEPGEGDPAAVQELAIRPGDWPCYAADNQRSFATTVSIPEKVTRRWAFQAATPSRPTAPVTAGGLVFVGDDCGVVRAIEAERGTPRWQAHTAGAVFFPPAVAAGRLYVGAADGRVYAFEAATGRPLWTFRAAPSERWIPVLGRLMSTWPASAGVVVEGGVVYTAAGMAHYDGTHVYALDAVTGKVKWHNGSSGTLSKVVQSGISLQGELSVHDGELHFPGGTIYQTARYDLATGKCLNEPVDLVKSQYPTAFYPFYPEYGQFVSLRHTMADGTTLSYEAAYEGSWHRTLARVRPPQPGQSAPLGPRLNARRPNPPPRDVVWESRSARKFNGFVVAPNALVTAGQAAADSATEFFLASVGLTDGSDVWKQVLPAAPVKGGAAIDHAGRIVVSLADGRLLCFGSPASAR